MKSTSSMYRETEVLRPYLHQVAGHKTVGGKASSLTDGKGHFYKPLQEGARGERELAFYELRHAGREVCHCSTSDSGCACHCQPSTSGRAEDAFCMRNAALSAAVPAYYGVVFQDDRRYLKLEDVACGYRRPCIMDVKLGCRTWYPGAEAAYEQKCRARDASTTQAALGFRVCGMQVYREGEGGYWRASKAWCKGLQPADMDGALRSFVDTGDALRTTQEVYGGASGALAQLQRLVAWFQVQRKFLFYSTSALLMYEGEAASAEGARVSVRMIDFAHTFPADGQQDTNCLQGIIALTHALSRIVMTKPA